MDNLYNPYSAEPIAPITRVKENLGLWTGQKYEPFRVDYIEPILRSSPYVIDVLALVAGVTQLAANSAAQAQLVPALQMNTGELFHARWYPLDDVEGGLYQLAGMPRNNMRGGQSRTSLQTLFVDPYLSQTTFWIYGSTPAKDAYIQVFNPKPVFCTIARFAYFGFRYILEALTGITYTGIYPNVQNITYLPAQGR